VDTQEINYARVAKVALDNSHHTWLLPTVSHRLRKFKLTHYMRYGVWSVEAAAWDVWKSAKNGAPEEPPWLVRSGIKERGAASMR
jgi:hypothetical protein